MDLSKLSFEEVERAYENGEISLKERMDEHQRALKEFQETDWSVLLQPLPIPLVVWSDD